jgi:hypothetical protein
MLGIQEQGAYTTLQASILILVGRRVIVSICRSLHGTYDVFYLTLLRGKSLP